MRIEAFGALVAVVWLTAVLCALVAASNHTLNIPSRKPRDHHLGNQFTRWASDESTTKRMTYPEMQSLIRKESGVRGLPVECCPTIEEMVQPQGGRNRQDMYVELYRDGENAQRFFEYSCRPDVLDKPCRFIDRKLQAQSRCVQKFAYAYAILQNLEVEQHRRHRHRPEQSSQPQQLQQQQQQPEHQFPAFSGNSNTSKWTLDYIRVRSGCSCEISPKARKRMLAAMKVKRTQSRTHNSGKAAPRNTVDFNNREA